MENAKKERKDRRSFEQIIIDRFEQHFKNVQDKKDEIEMIKKSIQSLENKKGAVKKSKKVSAKRFARYKTNEEIGEFLKDLQEVYAERLSKSE